MHTSWNERQMGWHERVHLRLGENLYYFFVKLSPLDRNRVRQELENVIQQHQLGSVRAFEIFGAYDLLVRAWLHPNLVTKFRGWLQGAMKESLRAIHIFEVTNVDYRWYSPADPKVLAKVNENTIRAAQQRGAQLDSLIESGIVTYREKPPGELGLIRFFTTVYLENSHPHEDVISDVIEELQKAGALQYLTVDRGFGFCSFLIKGESPDFFAIAEVPHWISRHFRAYRVTSETFFCHAAVPLAGGEMIGEATFTAMAGKDLFIYSLLPELYENTGYEKNRKDEVVAFLTHLRLKDESGLTLTEADKDLVHDGLIGYLLDSPTDTAKALFGLFADTERYVRNTYRELLGRRGVLQAATDSAGVVMDVKKHVALGDMLKILYQAGCILGEDRLKWESGAEFARFRNVLMHGALDSVSLKDFVSVVESLPGLRLLLEAIVEVTQKPYQGV